MSGLRAWRGDLAIGVRLAVGGGRTALARFVLSAIGVGIAVLVLLTAASVGTISANRDARQDAKQPDPTEVVGVAPTLHWHDSTEFRGKNIQVQRMRATGENSPLPPGVPRMPAADEMYVSPAMADLLADPANALVKPRFPQRVIGVLDPSVVVDPGDLTVYTGLHPDTASAEGTRVYKFGITGSTELEPIFLLMLLLGVVALLVPVFIFVASSTRIAGAERDRRLSALRLVGAGGQQVRRIAAAETLVSALAGLVLGGLLFLLVRPVVSSLRIMGVGVWTSDVVPSPWLVAVIAVAVPVLSVVTAQFALRRTIIEPLGVVRFSKPVRRRVWWRLVMVAAGTALLLWHGGADDGELWVYSIVAGATLMLVGVPVLLPVVVERTVARLRGGAPSWQLAVRRLQLDSGTSARVVGGIAVVLAGAIALQAVLLSVSQSVELPEEVEAGAERPVAQVWADPDQAEGVVATANGTDGVLWTAQFRSVTLQISADGNSLPVYIASCGDIERVYGVVDCADGDVFQPGTLDPAQYGFTPGAALPVVKWETGADTPTRLGEWTVPTEMRPMASTASNTRFGLVATPGAAPAPDPDSGVSIDVGLDAAKPDAIELLRNAFFNGPVSIYLNGGGPDYNEQQETFLTIRKALLIGSVFTLMLAGVSLLVLAVEHIRERRRPLAVLAASGVPTGAIARSLLWQIAVPIGLGVVVAVATGIALGSLVMRLATDPLVVDWAGVGLLTGAAALLGVLVCLVTLPFLRSATRVESLRTE
ncbi:FtsX-like permease family protein [Actinokineospora soli]|uniref:FtsX-like permease family protein n=1 Tax=Actinokineospora soli TaxID=1048753 RepID=A0ABW2TZ49_9PSEU